MRVLASAIGQFHPDSNPFILRNLRRELRHNRPLVAVIGTAVLLTAVFWFVLWQWRRSGAEPIPSYFGGSIGAVAVGVVIIFHLIVILHTSHARVARMLFAEASGQTLEQLLLTPMTRVELLLRMAAHPFLYSMLMALVGLPLYALAVMMGGLTTWQVVVLYVFFATISFATPITSDMQVARWRDPDTEVTASVAANRAARGARAGGWITTVVAILFGLPIGLTLVVAMISFPGAPGSGLVRFLPPALSPMYSGGFASIAGIYLWSYWLVVALAEPMPCFGHPISPIALYVLWWMLFRMRQFINGSADLQTPRAYLTWLAPRERMLTLCERALSSAAALMIVGYLWEPLVATGDLGLLISNKADTPHALAGLFTLLVGAGGWRGLRRGYAHFGNNGLPFKVASGMRRALRLLLQSIGIGILQYAVCCALGREKPVNPVVLNQAMRVLATLGGMAFTLWGVVALGNALVPPDERRGRLARPLLQTDLGTSLRFFFQRGGGRLSLDLIVFGTFWLIPLVALFWKSRELILFSVTSPWMGPIKMVFSHHETPHSPEDVTFPELLATLPWWHMPVAQIMLGCLCILIAAGRQRAAAITAASVAVAAAPASRKRPVATDSPTDRCVATLTSWLSRHWDNAVFIKDLRVRGRDRIWAVIIPTGMAVCLFIGMYSLYEPAIASGFHWTWDSIMPLPLGPYQWRMDPVAYASYMARIACLPLISAPFWVLWILGGAIAANEGSHSIEGERAKSTLEFLLVTPLSDREIVRGKLLGSMVPLLLLLARFAPVMLLGIVVAISMKLLPEASAILALGILFAGSALFASCATSMALATFPWGGRGDRSGWGGLVFIVVEVALLYTFLHNNVSGLATVVNMSVIHTVIGFVMLSICYDFVRRLRCGEVDFGGARRHA